MSLLLIFWKVTVVKRDIFADALERSPVIAFVTPERIDQALDSLSEIIFVVGCTISQIEPCIQKVHNRNKLILFHFDLTDGLGKDKAGVEYLASLGADGIISTRSHIIRFGNDEDLITVQRFFALDSKGVYSINDVLASTHPDFIEILPGVVGKVISYFSNCNIPVIAGGLIETKAEVTEAIVCGAEGVSTSCTELWNM